MDFGILANATANVYHVINRNEDVDDDWIVLLTAIPRWGNGGTYYTVNLWDDEPRHSNAGCLEHHIAVTGPEDIDRLIREPLADWYFDIHKGNERDDEWRQFVSDLEYDLVPTIG